MTHAELIYNAKNLISGGIQSDDEIISDEQMAFIINYYRAKLLKQDAERNRLSTIQYTQNLGLVDLIKADKNECCDIDPCAIRTKLQLPAVVNGIVKNLFTFVGTVDGTPFQHIYSNNVPYTKYAKWTGNLPKWYYQNGYIYFINMPTAMMRQVNIQGIFEDPSKAQAFRTCDCATSATCTDYYDYEYPLPLAKVDLILKLIAETELRILLGIRPDTTNNSLNKLEEPNGSN